jgi:hypothetical protein
MQTRPFMFVASFPSSVVRARLISQARLISRAPLTVASGALSSVDLGALCAVASGALYCVDPASPIDLPSSTHRGLGALILRRASSISPVCERSTAGEGFHLDESTGEGQVAFFAVRGCVRIEVPETPTLHALKDECPVDVD